ncbi:hypothetical protein NLJ89_g9913 [Agrocybe chaxingu]|uniref:DUF6534 domain-containing protein n=1 Tax=Agrocybe chaxingu TaxID=84603 RepID=A0A9W8JZ48_9AGAR|nr:hypothetical protein NLJ89_g9913 [Agrocybe chaxingu]
MLVYQPLILEFGQESALRSVPLGLIIIPPIVVAIATPIHLYVARRIHIIHQSVWVPIIICTLSFASMGQSLLSLALSILITHILILFMIIFASARLPAKLLSPALLWMIAAAVADLLIAAALSWSLYNRKTGYKSTDAVIDRIIFYWSSHVRIIVKGVGKVRFIGISRAIAALLSVITLVALPLSNTTTYVFNVTLMKLYGNFILATLNNRASWNNTLNHPETSVLFPQSAISASPDALPLNCCQCGRRPTVANSIPLTFARSRGQDPRDTTVEDHDAKHPDFSPGQAILADQSACIADKRALAQLASQVASTPRTLSNTFTIDETIVDDIGLFVNSELR